ncbi:SDR family NAD(P)-dependent oxidoreductase [Actinoplanes regularis]|uniref:Acetoacetyl-CoA reductase/3-oxoacyl-[acyl-carrier protein] reductase n=1 Tax=Actinoplanes regularis TaxID=52697 RepID=A0A239HD21_9ACTN|nr:SDR family NAD(P)-dependent oxidoreductase [Actinoplanes regularis]SNS78703.1 acetoacetyl-CoA reductase/3-oxoacyl-[acyl-carrier protein] reductase [Actinoplanes regularis]
MTELASESAGALAVVSGGTRGIGLAMSRRLIKLGHRVVALYHVDATAAAAAAAELGGAFHPLRLDIADGGAVATAAAEVLAAHGTPAVLVNNAGINIDRPFLQMSVEQWRRVLDTNLSGTFHLCHAFAPAMMASGRDGAIVNVGATTGIRPRRDGANYCASKAGVLQLTKCLALELAPRIRVNCLIPGMTETAELVTRFRLDDPAARAAVVTEIPRGRIGTTEEVADALEFLIGPASGYLTGQKLIVDGGQFMW